MTISEVLLFIFNTVIKFRTYEVMHYLCSSYYRNIPCEHKNHKLMPYMSMIYNMYAVPKAVCAVLHTCTVHTKHYAFKTTQVMQFVNNSLSMLMGLVQRSIDSPYLKRYYSE